MYHKTLTSTPSTATIQSSRADRMDPMLGFIPPELILAIGCLTPTKGDEWGASSMCNTPQNLLAEIQDTLNEYNSYLCGILIIILQCDCMYFLC